MDESADMKVEWSNPILVAFPSQHSARTECGYATVKDVRDHTLEDRMESFFLAETTKYIYNTYTMEYKILIMCFH